MFEPDDAVAEALPDVDSLVAPVGVEEAPVTTEPPLESPLAPDVLGVDEVVVGKVCTNPIEAIVDTLLVGCGETSVLGSKSLGQA